VPCRPLHSSSRVKLLNSGKKHPLSSLSTKLFFTRQSIPKLRKSDLNFPEQQTAATANSAPKPDFVFNVFYFILKSKDLVLSQFIKLLSRGSEEVSSAMSRIVDSESLNTRTGMSLIPAAATADGIRKSLPSTPWRAFVFVVTGHFFISQTSFEMNSHFLNKIFKR
jgi:hypothetical protein